MAGGIVVFYSTIFGPFSQQVEKLKSVTPALSEYFRTQYEIWIGYHAILQENSRKKETFDMDDDTLEKMLELDRTRVAKMQVKQAFRTAEMLHKLLKASTAE